MDLTRRGPDRWPSLQRFLTEPKTGAIFGYLHGLLKTTRLNNQEAPDRFLGFHKRAVSHYAFVRDNFAAGQ